MRVLGLAGWELGILPACCFYLGRKLGQMPSNSQLQRVGVTLDHQTEPAANTIPLEVTVPSQDLEGGKEKPPPFFLAAPGLPTVPSKLAQRIWDIDFIELEELLPSNKTIQALEEWAISRPEVSSLGLATSSQPQSRRVADISTWSRCFALYVEIMSWKRPDLWNGVVPV